MSDNRQNKLLLFLDRLNAAKIPYRLASYREGAISVEAYAPGEHWEVDFLADGTVDVERYRSHGKIDDESALDELFALCSDDEGINDEAANSNDTVARK